MFSTLFGYNKSINEITKEWGWLSLYQKYINVLKTYSGMQFKSKVMKIINKSIRLYCIR